MTKVARRYALSPASNADGLISLLDANKPWVTEDALRVKR